MFNLPDFPLLVGGLAFLAFWLATLFGVVMRERRQMEQIVHGGRVRSTPADRRPCRYNFGCVHC